MILVQLHRQTIRFGVSMARHTIFGFVMIGVQEAIVRM